MPSDQTTRDKKLILRNLISNLLFRQEIGKGVRLLETIPFATYDEAHGAAWAGHVLERKFHVLERKKRGSAVGLIVKNGSRHVLERKSARSGCGGHPVKQ